MKDNTSVHEKYQRLMLVGHPMWKMCLQKDLPAAKEFSKITSAESSQESGYTASTKFIAYILKKWKHLTFSDHKQREHSEDSRPHEQLSYWTLNSPRPVFKPRYIRFREKKLPKKKLPKPKEPAYVREKHPCGGKHTLTLPHQRNIRFEKLSKPPKLTDEILLLGYENGVYEGVIPKVEDEFGVPIPNDFDVYSSDMDEVLDVRDLEMAMKKALSLYQTPRYAGGQHTTTSPGCKRTKFIPFTLSGRTRKVGLCLIRGCNGKFYKADPFNENKVRIDQQEKVGTSDGLQKPGSVIQSWRKISMSSIVTQPIERSSDAIKLPKPAKIYVASKILTDRQKEN